MVGSLEEVPECGGGATQGGPLAPGALVQHSGAEGEIALGKEGGFSIQAGAHCSQRSKENRDSCLNVLFLFPVPQMEPLRPMPLGSVE